MEQQLHGVWCFTQMWLKGSHEAVSAVFCYFAVHFTLHNLCDVYNSEDISSNHMLCWLTVLRKFLAVCCSFFTPDELLVFQNLSIELFTGAALIIISLIMLSNFSVASVCIEIPFTSHIQDKLHISKYFPVFASLLTTLITFRRKEIVHIFFSDESVY